jgi:hypothetical protein
MKSEKPIPMQIAAWWIAIVGWGIFLGSVITSLCLTQSLYLQLDGMLLAAGGSMILRDGRGWKVAVLVYLLLCVMTVIGCAAWAILDPGGFRIGYLGLSFSHPTLPTVALALLISAVVLVPPTAIVARFLSKRGPSGGFKRRGA